MRLGERRTRMNVILEARHGEDGLSVRWRDQGESHYPWFWLRDHGEDAASLDPETLQRRVDTFALPDDIRASASAILDDGRTLEVRWPDAPEPSRYSADFLARLAGHAPPEQVPAPGVARRLWSAQSPLAPPPPLSHDAVVETEVGLRACLERLHTFGFAVIEGVPTDEAAARRLLTRFGYIRETIFGGVWRLSAELKEHGDTAYSTSALEPHTDATYCRDAPGLQSFLCLEFDGEGGESVLVDGFALAEALRRDDPESFQTLTEVQVPGRYIEPGVFLWAERPAIRLNGAGEVEQISFNNYDRAPFILPPQDMAAFYRAYRALHGRIVARANWLTLPLRPGMALIMDNWRVLHGRNGYLGTRVFCGCYHNREDFESALRTKMAAPTTGRTEP